MLVKVRFSKTTDRYKLYVSCGLIFNSGPNTVIMVWLGYGGENIRKAQCFCLKYLVWWPQSWQEVAQDLVKNTLEMSEAFCKNTPGLDAKSIAGDVT